jgi:hypothetical protein
VISWAAILYGAALSSIVATVAVAVLIGHRHRAVLAAVFLGASGGPIAWNTILRTTGAHQFFVDAPILVFPISWQDTGSGVFALAAPRRHRSASHRPRRWR